MLRGRVRCWGANTTAQLGDGSNVTRLTPVEVSKIRLVVTKSAGVPQIRKLEVHRAVNNECAPLLRKGCCGIFIAAPLVSPSLILKRHL